MPVRIILRRPGHVLGYPANPEAEAWLRVFGSRTPNRKVVAFSLPMLRAMRRELGVRIVIDTSQLTPEQLAGLVLDGLVDEDRT